MYAIFQDGGHQYRVEKGQRIRVQLKTNEKGDTVTFDRVCLLGGDGQARVGTPYVDGAKVEARVVTAEAGGDKVYPSFYRARKHSRRRRGHRQHFTEIEITGISG